MPRHPQGDKAMSGAERQRRWRERLQKEHGPKPETDQSVRAELTKARQEIERLREQLAAAQAKPASKAEPATATRELQGKLIAATFEIDRLRKQLDDARKAEPEQVAELRRRIHNLEAERERRDAAAKSRAAKVALDPNSEAARQIKGLVTRNRNLTRQLARALATHGHMNFTTMSLISKALHTDASPTKADRDEALKAFNAWKADSKDAARRKSR